MALRQGGFRMVFARAVAARHVAHLASWTGEQVVVFRSAFSGARLAATWPFGHGITRDDGEQLLNERVLLLGVRTRGVSVTPSAS